MIECQRLGGGKTVTCRVPVCCFPLSVDGGNRFNYVLHTPTHAQHTYRREPDAEQSTNYGRCCFTKIPSFWTTAFFCCLSLTICLLAWTCGGMSSRRWRSAALERDLFLESLMSCSVLDLNSPGKRFL